MRVKVTDWVVSASGNYPQGNLTHPLLRKMVETYDPVKYYEAKATIAHSSQWRAIGIPEPPSFGTISSIKVEMDEASGRLYMLSSGEYEKEFLELVRLYPGVSIEWFAPEDTANPLRQPHIPSELKNQPYFKGFVLLGATPQAVKGIPNKVKSLFSQAVTKELFDRSAPKEYLEFNAADPAQYTTVKSENKSEMDEMLKKLAAALGLPETATADDVLAAIGKMKADMSPEMMQKKITEMMSQQKPAPNPQVEKMQTEYADLKKEVAELKAANDALVATNYKEYSDRLLAEASAKCASYEEVQELSRILTTKEYGDFSPAVAERFVKMLPNRTGSTLNPVSDGEAKADEDWAKSIGALVNPK